MIHAQLDGDNVCIGYGDLKEVESAVSLVFLPDGWNEDFLWRKYENGTWTTEKFPPAIPAPGPDVPAEIDNLKAQDTEINLQIIDLFEQLMDKGVL